jgi:TM2 domain-containing membrane protein YozV
LLKKSTKAALLSCFVFPGVGHFYLKRFMLGVFLLVGAAVAGYVVFSSAMDTANEIVAKIQGGSASFNIEAISKLVEERSRTRGESTNFATWVFLALWLIGIVDCVRVGHKVEKAEGAAGGKGT